MNANDNFDHPASNSYLGRQIQRDRVEGPFGIPGGARTHLRSPKRTFLLALSWLRARWQLRHCTRVGSWPRTRGSVVVRNDGQVILGERIHLLGHDARSVLIALPGGTLDIGDRTFVNYGADIAATKLVKIGADCMIGTYANILDNDFHDLSDRYRVPEARPVHIGDRVWIGNHVIILPGVTIGEGAVIGAGSVVTSSVPAWTIAVGNPARVLKHL